MRRFALHVIEFAAVKTAGVEMTRLNRDAIVFTLNGVAANVADRFLRCEGWCVVRCQTTSLRWSRPLHMTEGFGVGSLVPGRWKTW
jgi:hypothetical protein